MSFVQRCVRSGRNALRRSLSSQYQPSTTRQYSVLARSTDTKASSLWSQLKTPSRRHSPLNFGMQKRTVFIKTESTPNPESLKFVPEGTQVTGTKGTHDFATAMSAVKSPLAKRLFRHDGIKRVYLGPDFVSVTKDPDFEWDELKGLIFAELSEFFQSGEEVVSDAAPPADTQILPEDSDTVAMIKELLETRVRPGLQDDGGDITYLGFIDNVVFVIMKGSCSGCPSSTTTVKQGVERMLQHWIPEVNGVVAVTSEEEFEQMTSGNASSESTSTPEQTTTA